MSWVEKHEYMEATNSQNDRINELSCEIAQAQTELYFEGKLDEVYEVDPNGDGESTRYTEKAQDVFDGFYDDWSNALTELVEMEG